MKIGLISCSNPLWEGRRSSVEALVCCLRAHGIEVCTEGVFYEMRTGKERAEALMRLYRDVSVTHICDISGGDLSNHVLGYLDYETIQKNPKPFWGYSDLTAVLNGIFAKTGNEGMLYNIIHLVGEDGELQQERFFSYLNGKDSLVQPEIRMLQGEALKNEPFFGGNIRCFLKLAGTEYFPEVRGKQLFLESRSGSYEFLTACLYQLKQMGVFERITGLLLGTFSQLDREWGPQEIEKMVMEIVDDPTLPIGRTMEVGHGSDSKAVRIG